MALCGVSIVRHVPTSDRAVRRVAALIAPVQQTLYGEDWDVKVEQTVTNVASRDLDLPLHMDLPYCESPPGLQLLHCLRFDAEVQGGESLLLDSFATLEQFRAAFPAHFDSLTKIPASWQYLTVGSSRQGIYFLEHTILLVITSLTRNLFIYVLT